MTRSFYVAICIAASFSHSGDASAVPHQSRLVGATQSARMRDIYDLCAQQRKQTRISTRSGKTPALSLMGCFPRGGSQNPVRFILRNLWKGITLPFPALRRTVLGAEKKQDMQIGLRLRESLGAVASYLTMGVLSYHFVLEPSWSIVDAMYFTVTCFTTVGYGDLCPSSLPSKAFTCVFGLVGIAFLGAAIATVTSSIVNSEVEAIQVAKEHSRKRFKEIFDDMPAGLKSFKRTPISEQDAQYEKARVSSIAVSDFAPSVLRRGLLAAGSALPSLLMVFAGGALVHRLNGGTGPWWDAMYYSVVTASTIGFGDFSPMTRRARIAAIFYIPLAVAAAGELLSGAATVMIERRQKDVYKRQLESMMTIKTFQDMDADGSGRVSRAEYIKFMLIEMGIVDKDELDELDKQFDRLDMSDTGYLDKEDLSLMAKYRGVEVSQ